MTLSCLLKLLSVDENMINMMTPFGSWLHIAASNGSIMIINYLIKIGFELDVKGGTLGGNALNIACSKGEMEIVELLLNSGATMGY